MQLFLHSFLIKKELFFAFFFQTLNKITGFTEIFCGSIWWPVAVFLRLVLRDTKLYPLLSVFFMFLFFSSTYACICLLIWKQKGNCVQWVIMWNLDNIHKRNTIINNWKNYKLKMVFYQVKSWVWFGICSFGTINRNMSSSAWPEFDPRTYNCRILVFDL